MAKLFSLLVSIGNIIPHSRGEQGGGTETKTSQNICCKTWFRWTFWCSLHQSLFSWRIETNLQRLILMDSELLNSRVPTQIVQILSTFCDALDVFCWHRCPYILQCKYRSDFITMRASRIYRDLLQYRNWYFYRFISNGSSRDSNVFKGEIYV